MLTFLFSSTFQESRYNGKVEPSDNRASSDPRISYQSDIEEKSEKSIWDEDILIYSDKKEEDLRTKFQESVDAIKKSQSPTIANIMIEDCTTLFNISLDLIYDI